jgi:hypothetical protein
MRGETEIRYTGMQFLLGRALPNFYFMSPSHTTSCAITISKLARAIILATPAIFSAGAALNP